MCDFEQPSCQINSKADDPNAALPPVGEFSPSDIKGLLEKGATFVVNLTTAWCGDCRDQKEVWPQFADDLGQKCILVMSVEVQGPLQDGDKRFYSPEYEELTSMLMNSPLRSNPSAEGSKPDLDRSTSVVGVHGRNRFPLTFLVINGAVASWEKEVTTSEGLMKLGQKFLEQFEGAFPRNM